MSKVMTFENAVKSVMPQEEEEKHLTVQIKTPMIRATDPDLTRYELGAVQVFVSKEGTAWCTGTDGRLLACHPCQVANAQGPAKFLIPHEVLPRRRSHLRYFMHRIAETWFSQWNLWGKTPEGRFPDAEKILEPVEPVDVVVLSLDVNLLHRVLTAAGGRHFVTLLVPAGKSAVNSPVGILPCDTGEGFGILMPLSQEHTGEANPVEAFNRRVKEFKEVASQS